MSGVDKAGGGGTKAAVAVVAAELTVLVCLVSGVDVPAPVLVGAEAAVGLVVAVRAFAFVRAARRTSVREAAHAAVPEPVRRLLGHELRVLASLLRWAARRRDGAGELFGYARDQAAMMYGLTFVCAVETVAMSYLLGGWPVVHRVVLVLDVYTVVLVLGLHAASVTRPHTLTTGADAVLRLRQSAWLDLPVPLAAVDSVRYELRSPEGRQDGVLDLPVGAQTSLTLRLTGPVTVTGLLGRTREVSVVRFHADAPRELLTRLRTELSARSVPDAPARSRPAGDR